MNNIAYILKDLEAHLLGFCKPILAKMQNGLTAEYIRSLFLSSNISNETLEQLFKWRNGVNFDAVEFVGEFSFSSQGRMLPLEEAIVHYEENNNDESWKKNYFPLFTSDAGDYLLYDVDRNSQTADMLLFYSPSLLITTPETAYDSLELFFKTVISCYQQKIYRFDDESNMLEIDDQTEFEVSHKLNPNSEYWIK